MKFIAPKSSLLRALQTVASVIPGKPLVPASGCILFTVDDAGKLTVMASNTGVFLQAHLDVVVEKSGSYMIPAELLLKTIKALPDCEVTIEVSAKNATIKAAKGVYKLGADSADHFGKPHEIGESRTFTIPADVLNAGLDITIARASTDELRPALVGVCFHSHHNALCMVGASNFRMGVLTYEGVGEFPSCILPTEAAKSLKDLFASHDVEVEVGLINISFSNEDYTLTAKLVDAPYPAYRAMIPTDYSYKLTVNRLALLQALRRMSIYMSNNGVCTYTFAPNELTLSANNVLIEGQAEEKLPCEWDGPDTHKQSFLNVLFVIECLDDLSSDDADIRFASDRNLVWVSGAEDKEVEVFVMPQAEKVG